MQDRVFGELTWDKQAAEFGHASWNGAVQVNYFRGTGSGLPIDPDDDSEQEHLPQRAPGERSNESFAMEERMERFARSLDMNQPGAEVSLDWAKTMAEQARASGSSPPRKEER